MTLPPLWAITGALAVVGGLATVVQTARLKAIQAEYGAFKTQIEVLGREAEREKQAKEDKYRKDKEKADESLKKLTISNQSLARSLRDSYASRSAVSWLSPTPRSSDLVCFNRNELDRTIQNYQSGILGIVEKGAEATLGLEIARQWAAEVK